MHCSQFATSRKLHLQSLLKRRVGFCILLTSLWLATGCDLDMPGQSSHNIKAAKNALPVALNQEPPFTYSANTLHIYGGDSFETIEEKNIHFVIVEGVSTPGSQQLFHEEAITFTRDLRVGGLLEIEVIARDELQREVAHVYGSDKHNNRVNLGLSLLENGLAWFDHSEGDYAVAYQAAEAKAKAAGIGIWSQPNPIPPWAEWEQHLKSIRSTGQ